MERQVCRILLYVPLYRDLPEAWTSWVKQAAPNTAVDLYIERFDPLPGAGPYPNLSVKSEFARRMALAGDYDYLWIVEDDIVLPDDALEKLLTAGNPIVSGLHRCRPETGGTRRLAERILDVSGPQDSDDRPLEMRDISKFGTLIECTQVSQGCLLIRKDLFLRLEGIIGRDYEMCAALEQMYVKILCHTGVCCGHIDQNGEVIKVGDE